MRIRGYEEVCSEGSVIGEESELNRDIRMVSTYQFFSLAVRMYFSDVMRAPKSSSIPRRAYQFLKFQL